MYLKTHGANHTSLCMPLLAPLAVLGGTSVLSEVLEELSQAGVYHRGCCCLASQCEERHFSSPSGLGNPSSSWRICSAKHGYLHEKLSHELAEAAPVQSLAGSESVVNY